MLPPLHTQLPILSTLHSQAHKCAHHAEPYQLLLNNFWKPTLSVIGFEGLPTNLSQAGNVVYKTLKLRVSLRLPPTLDSQTAAKVIREKLTQEGPETFGAKVELTIDEGGNGFDAPKLPESIHKVFETAH